MSNFLTLEDINSTIYSNQGFYWHEINTANITRVKNYTDVKIDFCTVTRTTSGSDRTFTVVIDNPYWTKAYYILDQYGNLITDATVTRSTNTLTIVTDKTSIRLFLYCGINAYTNLTQLGYTCKEDTLQLNYKELNTAQSVKVIRLSDGAERNSDSATFNIGYNGVTYNNGRCGFILVQLVKSDFQFNCTQRLVVGKVNKVKLGVDSDYLPSGDMIGNNTPTIKVLYKDTYIPVTYNASQNDYVFNLDLTSKENESNIRFSVIVEANDVINASETQVSLPCKYESINTENKIITLFHNGGVGRLTSDITLETDLTVNKSVYLVGNDKTLTMQGHRIIVPNGKTLKAEKLTFTGGENTIQQQTQSKAELTECNFTNCIGLGSVIDCQVDINSLENATDFTTILTACTFTNNDMCILHGGELTVTDCNITGKIGNKDYPFFLYQTDGEATITGTNFTLTKDTQITTDIEFNPCIFICGENAIINNGDHTEWQNNNITGFLENSKNTSIIDVSYYYDAISDYITLQSDNGYCHSASGIDFVFKTNITLTRED